MPKICYVPRRFRSATMDRIGQANSIIDEYVAQGFTLTLRQLYYCFVSRDLIPNTQRSYKQLGDVVNDGRLAGLIDWDSIEDRTRAARWNSHWDSPAQIIEACARQYSVDLWENQDWYVEVFIEKDALVGVIEGVCSELDVPYLSCRGYVSQSGMWAAAQRLLAKEEQGRRTVIIHLGDHDPSGLDMTRDIRDRLGIFGSSVLVKRIALTWDQIEEYSPPPNPAKATDARYEAYRREYGEESWELDALDPKVIASLIREEVSPLIDWELREMKATEGLRGRELLSAVAGSWDKIARRLGK